MRPLVILGAALGFFFGGRDGSEGDWEALRLLEPFLGSGEFYMGARYDV
jgi:hypothetical protein